MSDNDLIRRGDASRAAASRYFTGPECWQAVQEAIAAAPAQPCGVTVKPLAWESSAKSGYEQANCNLGQYQIMWLGEFECWQLFCPARPGQKWADCFTRFARKADAKAAAQADYEARILAALDVQPITVQDAARVEHVAFSLWKAEAERAAPNVARNRTPEMFLGELESTRAKWLSLADAAMRAIAEGK